MYILNDNDIRIDSHKLIYHPEVVSQWLKGKMIYPIELEIAPSGACNHRCIFCAVDYIGYKSVSLDKDLIINMVKELHPLGLKSIIHAGEGEPLLNKNIGEILNAIKEIGVDSAMSSNGVLLTKKLSQEVLHALKWIRFSISAVTPSIYSKIHRTKESDIDKVLNNLEEAVAVKRDQKLKTTLGSQLLLIPENINDVINTALALKKTGIDYLSIKPYSQHPESKNVIEIDYKPLLELESRLKEIETDDFRIFFRASAMKNKILRKNYDQCYGLPFFSYIDANGSVWPCISFLGNEKYCYGNLYKNTFVEIWNSENKILVDKKISELDLNKECREICRNNEINKYLYELKNPSEHVNFI